MLLTLGGAARAAGVSKTAIAQAIATGRLSAAKDDLGRWQIDPAELSRVYPPQGEQIDDVEHPPVNGEAGDSPTALLYERLLAEKDRQIASLAEQNAGLADMLETANEERRQAQNRLTALLTDQRPARRRWWRFGRQSRP